jgi:hypothetical protein
MRKTRHKIELSDIKFTEVKGLPDLSNDPFVIKKRELALEFIRKNGLPKELKHEEEKILKYIKENPR